MDLRNKRKQRRTRKRIISSIAIILGLVIVFFAVSFALDVGKAFRNKDAEYEFVEGPGGDIAEPPSDLDAVEWEDESGGEEEPWEKDYGPITYTVDPDRVNILLIGVDKRPGSKRAPLSDTIMIFSIHKKSGETVLISIPRDTYVSIPGKSKNKINASHAFGGAALLRKTIEEFTGIPIHYYLRVNFEGFVGIVDMLGGVEIYVDRNIKHLKQGTQVLSGEDALLFCRFRKEARGDFARAERQQRFLVTTAKQVLKKPLKIPGIVKEGVKYVDTDMPLLTVLDFAEQFSNLDPDAATKYVVPGKGFYHKGTYFLQPKVLEMREFIVNHLEAN